MEEVENHAIKYSQSYRKYRKSGNTNDAIWASQFEKMALKTVLKSLISKYGIMSIQLQNAIKSDYSSINIDLSTGEETLKYIDNQNDKNNKLSTEEQRKLLEEYPLERINATLEECNMQSLNELSKTDLNDFISKLKKVKV